MTTPATKTPRTAAYYAQEWNTSILSRREFCEQLETELAQAHGIIERQRAALIKSLVAFSYAEHAHGKEAIALNRAAIALTPDAYADRLALAEKDVKRLELLEKFVRWNDSTNTALITFPFLTNKHCTLREAVDAVGDAALAATRKEDRT